MTVMVRASGIRGYVQLMRSLPADFQSLLDECRIPLAALENDDQLIPLWSVMQLLQLSAQATGIGDLGLRIAQYQDPSVMGPVGIALQSAATMEEGMRYASRYMFVHSPGLAFHVLGASTLVDDAVEVVVEIRLDDHPPQRQTIDLCLGSAHRMILLTAGKQYALKAVSLPHTPAASLNDYKRFFGAPIVVDQRRAALHISRASFQAPLVDANPALRQITEDYLNRHFRNPSDSFSDRVRRAVRRTLGTQQCDKTSIASMLAVHPRTLQRRLDREGSSFLAIKDEIRQSVARQYLRESEIPLSQLSFVLGFPEQSALTRACKRWFMQTPSALRRRGAAPE